MKRFFLLLNLLLISLVTASISYAETIKNLNSDEITIELTHETQSQKETIFLVYAISEQDYEYALSKKYETSIEKSKQWLKEKGISQSKEVHMSSSNKVRFNLPKYNEQRDYMYYVIIQNKPDREGINGKNIYESLPIFISLDQTEEDFLEIQTKRFFTFNTPYFFKYSSEASPKPLKGAEFILYRLTADNKKEYLFEEKNVGFSMTEKIKDAWKFTSNEDGLVILPNLELPIGSYYFEEIKAPIGYDITEESKKIQLVIKEDLDIGLVMIVNGEQLKSVQAGELPKDVIEKGTPRILNSLTKEPPSKENPVPKIPTEKEPLKNGGFLPKTGEEMMMFSSFGLLLMLIALGLMKRGKENE